MTGHHDNSIEPVDESSLKPALLLNQLAVNKNPVHLRPNARKQQRAILFNDNVMSFDGTLPAPRRVQREVSKRIPGRLEDLAVRPGIEGTSTCDPIS